MSKNLSFKNNRVRRLLLPAGIGIVVIILLSAVILTVEPEVLSPDEIMAKQEWTDQELQDILAKTMSPTMSGIRKNEVLKHLNNQMKKRSKQQQEEIRIKAVAGAVTASLDQIRKMPKQEQSNMLKTIQTRAEQRYNEILSDKKRRKEASEQMQTKEMEAFAKEVNRVILTELTPEERVQFAPITKLWIRSMKMIGH